MSRKNSSKSSHDRIGKLSKSSPTCRSQYRYSSSTTAREALYRAIHEIDTKNKKRSKQVEKLRYLIYELQSLQPTDVLTLSTSLGQCENTTRSQLKKLEKLELRISAKSLESDKLFGSVTSAEIVKELSSNGFEIEKKCIQLSSNIKKTGAYTAKIRLHREVYFDLNFEVIKSEK